MNGATHEFLRDLHLAHFEKGPAQCFGHVQAGGEAPDDGAAVTLGGKAGHDRNGEFGREIEEPMGPAGGWPDAFGKTRCPAVVEPVFRDPLGFGTAVPPECGRVAFDDFQQAARSRRGEVRAGTATVAFGPSTTVPQRRGPAQAEFQRHGPTGAVDEGTGFDPFQPAQRVGGDAKVGGEPVCLAQANSVARRRHRVEALAGLVLGPFEEGQVLHRFADAALERRACRVAATGGVQHGRRIGGKAEAHGRNLSTIEPRAGRLPHGQGEHVIHARRQAQQRRPVLLRRRIGGIAILIEIVEGEEEPVRLGEKGSVGRRWRARAAFEQGVAYLE